MRLIVSIKLKVVLVMMAERLRGKLAEKGAKRLEIASLLKLSKATVTNKMHGSAPITLKEFTALAKRYNFSNEDILYILFGGE